MAVTAEQLYTPEEYFALEEKSEIRHEFYAGRIYAMAGASVNHNRIVRNVAVALTQEFSGKPCEVFAENVRLSLDRKFDPMYTYPDAMAVCGAIEYEGKRVDTIKNPVLIFEVWSDSTRGYDRGDKFEFHRQIPTLQEYVMIDQSRVHVELYRKGRGAIWELRTFDDPLDIVELVSVGVTIEVAALYTKVEFA